MMRTKYEAAFAWWTICGSHKWFGGPLMATKIAVHGPEGLILAGPLVALQVIFDPLATW